MSEDVSDAAVEVGEFFEVDVVFSAVAGGGFDEFDEFVGAGV